MNRRDRRCKLDDIAHVGETLRSATIAAPDFTSSILDRVDVERPFLAPSVRRKLPWIRLGLGACVALSILSIALTHRYAPTAVQLVAQPAPMSDVVQCVECGAFRKYAAYRPAMLNVTEQDCSKFFVAMTAMSAAADIAQSEGRRPAIGDDTSTALSAILPLSQAVGLDMLAPPTNAPIASMASHRSIARLRASVVNDQSVFPAAGGPALLMSAEMPRVRVVPSFLDHDLDGLVFPR